MTSSEKRHVPRQRAAVAAMLAEQVAFRSAQQLHAAMRQRGSSIGLSTVYRVLRSMAFDGEVDVVRTAEGEALYRQWSKRHHHHLVCRRCGLSVELEDQPVDQWARRIANEHGFSDLDNQLEVFGTCAACVVEA